MFLLQDSGGAFLQAGHGRVVTAKKERESKQSFGAKGEGDRVGPPSEVISDW